jgi:hypothetical protein
VDTTKQLKDHRKKSVKPRTRKPSPQKLWFERYRWFISSNGNLVVAGKDAATNEKVVKKYLEKGDRYVHAVITGAPSCIVKAQDVESNPLSISSETLREACQFAVAYSRAWKQFAELEAYWVNPEQVSKTPPSGEYLPRGSFMISGKRTYEKCVMALGIGQITLKGVKKVMGAPPSVAKKTEKWVVLTPGVTDKNQVAAELMKIFETDVETLQATLPSGGITIAERGP